MIVNVFMFSTVHISLITFMDVLLFPARQWLPSAAGLRYYTVWHIHIYTHIAGTLNMCLMKEKSKSKSNCNFLFFFNQWQLSCSMKPIFKNVLFKTFDQVPIINICIHIAFCIANFTHLLWLLLGGIFLFDYVS